MLIVGAAGGVGSFLTQFAALAGAHVDAAAAASEADRMTGYGAGETIDRAAMPLPEAVARAHRDGIDVLVDVASDAAAVRRPGRATCGPAEPRSPLGTSPISMTLARAGVTGRELRAVSMTVAAAGAAGSCRSRPGPSFRRRSPGSAWTTSPLSWASPVMPRGKPSSRCRPGRAPKRWRHRQMPCPPSSACWRESQDRATQGRQAGILAISGLRDFARAAVPGHLAQRHG